MEEDIKILKQLQKDMSSYNDFEVGEFGEKQIEAIENLLKRNEELEEKYNYEKNRARTELDTVYINARYDERDNWISKVKEKIEELNRKINDIPDGEGDFSKAILIRAKITLQELLEEE